MLLCLLSYHFNLYFSKNKQILVFRSISAYYFYFTLIWHVAFFFDVNVTVIFTLPFLFLAVILYLFLPAFFIFTIFLLFTVTFFTASALANLLIVRVYDFFLLIVFFVAESLIVGFNFAILCSFFLSQLTQYTSLLPVANTVGSFVISHG